MKRNKFIFVPSLFTVLNMFSGFLAILYAMNDLYISVSLVYNFGCNF
jgi:phosphatidylserine synthase